MVCVDIDKREGFLLVCKICEYLVLQPTTVRIRYRGCHMFNSVHYMTFYYMQANQLALGTLYSKQYKLDVKKRGK